MIPGMPYSSDQGRCEHLFYLGEPRCRACNMLKAPTALAEELALLGRVHKIAYRELPEYRNLMLQITAKT